MILIIYSKISIETLHHLLLRISRRFCDFASAAKLVFAVGSSARWCNFRVGSSPIFANILMRSFRERTNSLNNAPTELLLFSNKFYSCVSFPSNVRFVLTDRKNILYLDFPMEFWFQFLSALCPDPHRH